MECICKLTQACQIEFELSLLYLVNWLQDYLLNRYWAYILNQIVISISLSSGWCKYYK